MHLVPKTTRAFGEWCRGIMSSKLEDIHPADQSAAIWAAANPEQFISRRAQMEMYAIAEGQPIPKEVEDYDGSLVAGQNITIVLDQENVWQVTGNDLDCPLFEASGCTFINGQRGGVRHNIPIHGKRSF